MKVRKQKRRKKEGPRMSEQSETKYREALVRIRQRITNNDPALSKDVSFALGELIEADMSPLPEGKRGIIVDLKRKAEAAEKAHDPESIQMLLQGLKAFFDEELKEPATNPADMEVHMQDEKDEKKDEAPPPEDTSTEECNESEDADDADSGNGTEDDDESDAEESDVMAQPDNADGDDEPGTIVCEACGHKQVVKEMAEQVATTGVAGSIPPSGGLMASTNPMTEAKNEPPKETKMQETNKDVLTDQERAELVALRAREANRQLMAAAKKKIREAEIFFDPKDLIAFRPEQWDAVLKMATQPKSYFHGTREHSVVRENDRKSHAKPQTAAEFFLSTIDRLGN